jgi:hypothetical protein
MLRWEAIVEAGGLEQQARGRLETYLANTRVTANAKNLDGKEK